MQRNGQGTIRDLIRRSAVTPEAHRECVREPRSCAATSTPKACNLARLRAILHRTASVTDTVTDTVRTDAANDMAPRRHHARLRAVGRTRSLRRSSMPRCSAAGRGAHTNALDRSYSVSSPMTCSHAPTRTAASKLERGALLGVLRDCGESRPADGVRYTLTARESPSTGRPCGAVGTKQGNVNGNEPERGELMTNTRGDATRLALEFQTAHYIARPEPLLFREPPAVSPLIEAAPRGVRAWLSKSLSRRSVREHP